MAWKRGLGHPVFLRLALFESPPLTVSFRQGCVTGGDQADLLSPNRSNAAMMEEVKEVARAHPRYGHVRLAQRLAESGKGGRWAGERCSGSSSGWACR